MRKSLYSPLISVAMLVALSAPALASMTTPAPGSEASPFVIATGIKGSGPAIAVASVGMDKTMVLAKADRKKAVHKAKAHKGKTVSLSPGMAFAPPAMIATGLAVGAGTFLTGKQKLLAKYDGGAIPSLGA